MSNSQRGRVGGWRFLTLVAVWMGVWASGVLTTAGALQINGVQPYALDQPRVPALLAPASGGPPLSAYSELVGQRVFAIDCFLDTGASRMVISRSDRDVLHVRTTGQTVEDFGIAGTERFDVSIPYRVYVADSTADTTDPRQFRYGIRCVLQLRRNDQNPLTALPKGLSDSLKGLEGLGVSAKDLGDMLTPAINIIGTPFLQNYVAILDPRPVVSALGAVAGMLGGGGDDGGGDAFAALDELLAQLQKSGASATTSLGRMKVDILPFNQQYVGAQIVVPLTMRSIEPKPVPVTKSSLPFVSGVLLTHFGRSARVSLLVDTGGGMSLLSTRVARRLGLNMNQPPLTAFVQGVGKGGVQLKGDWVARAVLPTLRGGPLVYNRVPFFISDIAGIDGTIGVNMLVPSIYIDMNMTNLMANPLAMLGNMKNGPMPFKRIIIDLPRRQLGLDPA